MSEFYFTGDDLKDMSFEPGPYFKDLLKRLNVALASGASDEVLTAILDNERTRIASERAAYLASIRQLQSFDDITYNISVNDALDRENLAKVNEALKSIVRTPTVRYAAVMPDACPTGAMPVGAVVGAENAIHPGWHSADICCSLYGTNLGKVDPEKTLDAICSITHFGPGGRHDKRFMLPPALLENIRQNPFANSKRAIEQSQSHLGTQGDGNHFASVNIDEDDNTWLITHHGSRGFGAQVYKAGLQAASEHCAKIAPDVSAANSWLDADSEAGIQYWLALQLVRLWTIENHRVLHNACSTALQVAPIVQLFNEHNFVFRKDNMYYHAKGSTPMFVNQYSFIPLSMADPILLVTQDKHLFAPHGAGRTVSRTQHSATVENVEYAWKQETQGIDARSYSGIIDATELPSAYKRATAVIDDISRYSLAKIIKKLRPYGNIMAGKQKAWIRA